MRKNKCPVRRKKKESNNPKEDRSTYLFALHQP